MSKWKVQNINYDFEWLHGEQTALLERVDHGEHPWEVSNPNSARDYRVFATHAEAVTYADKQARRTP